MLDVQLMFGLLLQSLFMWQMQVILEESLASMVIIRKCPRITNLMTRNNWIEFVKLVVK
jgi:hypothetical protein